MKKIFTCIALASLVLFQACKDDDDNKLSQDEQIDLAIGTYADIVYATYDDSYKTAVALKTAVDALVADPSETTLEAAKTAWKAARFPYGQSEGFRFYDGPIDGANGPEGLINAWPIDESYIDYVDNGEGGMLYTGIINDSESFPEITKDLLIDLNEDGGETNISTGYHAIEFLLWGQDFSTTGPGDRTYEDYVTDEEVSAPNTERRGEYLKAVTELLVENLKTVRDAWAEGAAYREAFENNANTAASLGDIFRGMAELSKGELAGERMTVAATPPLEQENEHSCFSDNTDVDIMMNFKSVQNIYMGSYTRVDGSIVSGTSFASIAAQMDEAKLKNDLVLASFVDAAAKILDIPKPFDQAIANNPAKILTAATSISTLSDRIVDVGSSLGAAQ